MTSAPPLSAVELGFSYPNGVQVITGWTSTFPAGSMTALTGPSGSGKSTLLYVLGLMQRHQTGDLLLHGRPVAGLSDAERARLRAHQFGFVFQDAALDPTRSVLDNVVETALYRRQSRKAAVSNAHTLLERFGVALRASHRPGEISGGQAQRIALCRALLAQPRIILADEPTGNLDPASRDLVVAALRKQAEQGSCVIIATHDPLVAQACHRHVALDGQQCA
ncbi:ABC transporter ATP-binding protein [Phytoactinopolyspora limicola]|uniref:ABC transporter ATP-binding protein n=1 Tax=Phytoactinopolyspora limicola TaxID=2715536 RepID=UPI00140C0281|nr:ABC transporter ATP-binding protein [Phytoactinopolyspora limicola]